MRIFANNEGLSMTFENGLTISILIGKEHYCSRYMVSFPEEDITSAEVQVRDTAGNQMEPQAYRTPNEIARLITAVASASKIEDIVIAQ